MRWLRLVGSFKLQHAAHLFLQPLTIRGIGRGSRNVRSYHHHHPLECPPHSPPNTLGCLRARKHIHAETSSYSALLLARMLSATHASSCTSTSAGYAAITATTFAMPCAWFDVLAALMMAADSHFTPCSPPSLSSSFSSLLFRLIVILDCR